MAKIVIIMGPPGSGKSSIARALARAVPRGYHLEVDLLRESMLSGFAFPAPPDDGEWVEQFALARSCAAFIARTYADAGVDVFVSDAEIPHERFRPQYDGLFDDHRTTSVYVHPGHEEIVRRVAARGDSYDEALLEALQRPGMREAIASLDASAFDLQLRDGAATLEENVSAITTLLAITS